MVHNRRVFIVFCVDIHLSSSLGVSSPFHILLHTAGLVLFTVLLCADVLENQLDKLIKVDSTFTAMKKSHL